MEYPKIVYAMQHRTTKKIYIGLTNNLEARYKAHLSLLRHNKHTARLMQEEYNEHGGLYDVFILDQVKNYTERVKERNWQKHYQTQDPRYGYNQEGGKVENTEPLPLKGGVPERSFC